MYLSGQLQQRSGRAIISGPGFDSLPCDGQVSFTLEVRGENGLFVGGRADAFVQAYACNEYEYECASDFVEQGVSLRRSGRR